LAEQEALAECHKKDIKIRLLEGESQSRPKCDKGVTANMKMGKKREEQKQGIGFEEENLKEGEMPLEMYMAYVYHKVAQNKQSIAL
jgi:hypothetical protein